MVLEPILAKHVHIKKDRTVSEETVISLLVGCNRTTDPKAQKQEEA